MRSKIICNLKYSQLVEAPTGNMTLKINRACGAGLFSNFTTLLWDLARCRERGYVVHNLSAGIGAEFYKDRREDDPIQHILDLPKQTKEQNFFSLPLLEHIDHHGVYSELTYKNIMPYINMFFKPSELVRKRISEIMEEYSIDLSNTLCVCYRGTDKSIEVPRVDVSVFLSALKENFPDHLSLHHKVLIQTDELEIRDRLLMELGEYAFYFKFMPVAKRGDSAIHLHRFNNKLDFAVDLYAINLIISKLTGIVTHTGNMALWQFILRGTADKIIQI